MLAADGAARGGTKGGHASLLGSSGHAAGVDGSFAVLDGSGPAAAASSAAVASTADLNVQEVAAMRTNLLGLPLMWSHQRPTTLNGATTMEKPTEGQGAGGRKRGGRGAGRGGRDGRGSGATRESSRQKQLQCFLTNSELRALEEKEEAFMGAEQRMAGGSWSPVTVGPGA